MVPSFEDAHAYRWARIAKIPNEFLDSEPGASFAHTRCSLLGPGHSGRRWRRITSRASRRELAMKTHASLLVATATVVFTLAGATHAGAQVPRRYPTPNAPAWSSQSAYDDGYQLGVRDGEQDGRNDRGYRGNVRDAWQSRRGRYGNDLRQAFENGYSQGYQEGYGRFDRRSSRDRGYEPSYRAPGPFGGYGGYGRYTTPAIDNGYRDGYEEGLDAGRDRDRFDPVGERDYRKADRGYNGRFGPKDRYQAEYRDAFRRGYEEGYRDATRYDRRRDSRGPRGSRWPWVF